MSRVTHWVTLLWPNAHPWDGNMGPRQDLGKGVLPHVEGISFTPFKDLLI